MRKQPEINLKEKFYIFDNFLTSNKYILDRGDKEWDSSKIFFQLAIEHADNSPLTIDAEKFKEDGKVDWDYVRDVNRENEMYISPLYKVLKGHTDSVNGIVVLDDKNIMSFSSDGTLRIWEIENFEIIDTITISNEDPIYDVILLNNGNVVLSVMDDNNSIYMLNSRFETIKVLKKHNDFVNGLIKISENRFCSYSQDGNIYIYDNDGNMVIGLYEHTTSIQHIKSFKQHTLISQSSNEIIIWSDHFEVITKIEKVENDFDNIELFPNNNLLFYSEDKIVIYDTNNNNILKELNIYSDIAIVKILNNDQILINFYSDEKAKVVDINTFNELNSFNSHEDLGLDIKILKDNNIISWGNDNIIKIWRDNFKYPYILKGHKDYIEGIVIMDNFLLSYSRDESIIVWNLKNLTYSRSKTIIPKVKYTKILNQDKLITWGLNVGEIIIWNKNGILHTIQAHDEDIESNGIIILDNGNILSIGLDACLKVWDKDTFDNIAIFKTEDLDYIFQVEIISNFRIATYQTNSIYVLDIKDLHVMYEVECFEEDIEEIKCFNQKYLLIYLENGNFYVFDIETYKIIKDIKTHDNGINDLLYLDNNHIAILAGNIIKILNEDFNEVYSSKEKEDKIIYGLIDIDITHFIYYTENIINLINKDTYNNIASFNDDTSEIDIVKLLSFNRILVTFINGDIKILDLNSLINIATLTEHKEAINNIIILENCDFISYTNDKYSEDIKVNFWNSKNYSLIKKYFYRVNTIEITSQHILIYLHDKKIILIDKDTYRESDIIDKKNLNDYLIMLKEEFTNGILSNQNYIYENYFGNDYIRCIDLNNKNNILWHSMFQVYPNKILNNNLFILESSNRAKILKVIKH